MTIDQIKELAGHREVSPWIIKLVQDAVLAEREACAKVCEKVDDNFDYTIAARQCAAAIRSRSSEH